MLATLTSLDLAVLTAMLLPLAWLASLAITTYRRPAMPNDYDAPAQQAENCLAPQYAVASIAGGLGYPQTETSIEEKNRYHAQQWLMILRQAHEIRQNPEAMALVRDLIRRERDSLAAVLDET